MYSTITVMVNTGMLLKQLSSMSEISEYEDLLSLTTEERSITAVVYRARPILLAHWKLDWAIDLPPTSNE